MGIFFKSRFDTGIMCIGDFLSDNAAMDNNTFVTKYNIISDYFIYHGNINAIPLPYLVYLVLEISFRLLPLVIHFDYFRLYCQLPVHSRKEKI